jgi:hypothetical protein
MNIVYGNVLVVSSMLACLIFNTICPAQGRVFPTFEKFRVSVTDSRSRQPNLRSHKKARLFRTNLRNAAKKGINFAGHYVLTFWGCGTNCASAAIIEAKSGRVYFPPQLDQFVWGLEMYNHVDNFLVYYSNSRLLVLYGDVNQGAGTHYFVRKGDKLREIAFDNRTDEQP